MQSVSHGHRDTDVGPHVYVHCRILLNKSTIISIILSTRSFVCVMQYFYFYLVIMCFQCQTRTSYHNNIAYFNDITHVIMQYKHTYMNSQNSVCYRIRTTFVRSNTSSNHIKQTAALPNADLHPQQHPHFWFTAK